MLNNTNTMSKKKPLLEPLWSKFLFCADCGGNFNARSRLPTTLKCGHTKCHACLKDIKTVKTVCRFHSTTEISDSKNLPINSALIRLINLRYGNNTGEGAVSLPTQTKSIVENPSPDDFECYKEAKEYMENLALNLKSFVDKSESLLPPPIQQKIVTLISSQLMEEEGRIRAFYAARSLGERIYLELILQHQTPDYLIPNIWKAVHSWRARILEPSMQKEFLERIVQALGNSARMRRKEIIAFVLEHSKLKFPHASKESINLVIQLLVRAKCFENSKLVGEFHKLELKREFCSYAALRQQHDIEIFRIVQMENRSCLRMAPKKWSALLFGNTRNESYIRQIIDKVEPSSDEEIPLQSTGDQDSLEKLHTYLEKLANIYCSLENEVPTWNQLKSALHGAHQVVVGFVAYMQYKKDNSTVRYKIKLCPSVRMRIKCNRLATCTFAHSNEEQQRNREKYNDAKASGAAADLDFGFSSTPMEINIDSEPSGRNSIHSDRFRNIEDDADSRASGSTSGHSSVEASNPPMEVDKLSLPENSSNCPE